MNHLAALDHLASQATFRVLLDALARPGTVHHLPEGILDVDVPAALLVPLALADLEVGVAVLAPAGPDWAAEIRAATRARHAEPERADLVVALRPPRPEEVRGLRRGTLDRPDLGCRLVLTCDAVGAPAGVRGEVAVSLSGPGVPDTTPLAVTGLPVETVEALLAANRRYPLGIDSYLVGTRGDVVGLPRSTRVDIRSGAGTFADVAQEGI